MVKGSSDPHGRGSKLAKTATGKVVAANAKKDQKERASYTLQDFRRMAVATLQKRYPSAEATANSAEFNFPKARSSLERYVSDIRKDPSLQRATPAETLEARVTYALHMEYKTKGNDEIMFKRLFSDDNLAYFARSLKIYADLGWPMDVRAAQRMMSRAAKAMGVTDTMWKPGDEYVVSRSYVTSFLNNPKWELKTLKASNIDPQRSKKASSQVSLSFTCRNSTLHLEYHTVRLSYNLTCHILRMTLGETLPIFRKLSSGVRCWGHNKLF